MLSSSIFLLSSLKIRRIKDVYFFSSIVFLGVIVAIEYHYHVKVTKHDLAFATDNGVTLRKIAEMVLLLKSKHNV